MEDNKYQYNPQFQKEILQFSVTDIKYGFKAVLLFESHYFTLVEHSIIAEVLKRYYNRKFSVPSKAVMKEELRQLLRLKQWGQLVDKSDREKILKTITS